MAISRSLLIVVGFAACLWLVFLLTPVLTPFMVGALLAYLGDPLVDRLERYRLSRTLGVVCVFSVMLIVALLAVIVLAPVLQQQVISVLKLIPRALEYLQEVILPALTSSLGVEAVTLDIEAVKETLSANWKSVGSVAGQVVAQLGKSGQLLMAWASFVFLVPVVAFYLLRDWDRLVGAIGELVPPRHQQTVKKIAAEIDAVVAEFLRGQLSVMFVLAIIYTAGLWLLGLELALFTGLLAGIVSFVPYIGVVVGIVVAGLAALLQFQDPTYLIGVALVFGVGQLLEGMVLSPLLVGDRIGLHPVAVIFAVLAGGQLFGFLGVLLALPVAAVIVVLLRHSKAQYLASDLYS
ncbi:MAG: AI-2E family transporter [Pseudomonadota bacterium]